MLGQPEPACVNADLGKTIVGETLFRFLVCFTAK
jgi:hypothetical protein